MKKISFILILVLAGTVVLAQSHYVTGSKRLSHPRLYENKISPDGKTHTGGQVIPGQKSITDEIIGDTYFDTQTYNSGNEMNRIYEFPDGNIGATWIDMGTGTPPDPDRGTGYNYYDGSAWTGTLTHLGSDTRDGFPSYAPWGANGEIVEHYQYIANDGPLKILRRDVKGTGSWQESVLNPPVGNFSIVWASMITSGVNHEFVHILAYTYDNPYMGQTNALLYYRSPDGGLTWDINGVIIPGLDAAFYPGISSLQYSWAQPVGNTLAFTYGFNQFDGLVFKSTDNGTTWTKMVVYQGPFDPNSVPDQTAVYGSGDGTSAITLDSQGKVHVVFCREFWFHDVLTTPPGGWYYYPTSAEGVIYWHEGMPQLDSTIVSSYTLDFLAAGGNLIGWVYPVDTSLVIPSTQPNYGVGLTSMPQIGIDANDKLFVVWAALAPLYSDGTNFYRHLYGNSSYDGGTTWNGIRDLNSDFVFAFSECVFPAVSPIVNQRIRVLFQEDDVPGTGQGNDSYMDYFDFPEDFFTGIPTQSKADGFRVSVNYPNPASRLTQFDVKLDQAAEVGITLTNLTGQVVTQLDPKKLNSGNNMVTLDVSGLQGGVYFCSFEVNGQKITRKIVVK